MGKIESNIEEIRKIINRFNKNAVLVAVTKNVSKEDIITALKAGIKDFGESKAQEAIPKIQLIKEEYPVAKWHFIGNLQGNKVNKVIKYLDLIQSVESVELAREISVSCVREGISKEIFLEAKISEEATKHGMNPDAVIESIQNIKGMQAINLSGIMTIAPDLKDEESIRPYFKTAKRLFDEARKLNGNNVEIKWLSMGMTNDYEIALQEGSNMVRIGTGIFGKRITE